MRMPFRTSGWFLAAWLLVTAVPARAIPELPLKVNLGLGVLLPGEAEVDIHPPKVDVETQAALLLKAGVDVEVLPNAFVSGCVLHSRVDLNEESGFLAELPEDYREEAPSWVSGLQFSLGPKVSVPLGRGLALQLALYGGYRAISSDADIANIIAYLRAIHTG